MAGSHPHSPTPPDSCASTSVVSPVPAVAAQSRTPSLVCSHSVVTATPPRGRAQYCVSFGAGGPDACWDEPQAASSSAVTARRLSRKRDVVEEVGAGLLGRRAVDEED